MDFSHVPDNVFLQIFKYLPIQDCVRLVCVNKSFHRMSQLVISSTKFLDLTNKRFRKLSADQLAVILDLCSPNLEKIEIGFPSGHELTTELATTLANYECPRLTDIILGTTRINRAVCEQLIRNNSNLECFSSHSRFVGFPNVISNNLKKLYLAYVNDVTLHSMVGRIPNLKDLCLLDANVTANVLDEFFASTPQIQRLMLVLAAANQMVFDESLVNFWNLPLTYLHLSVKGELTPEDGVLQKVGTSFPHLQDLQMEVSNPSSHGISALAALQELEILKLDIYNAIDDNDNDDGIRALVACKQLRCLTLAQSITSGVMIALLRGCLKLEFIRIILIEEVDTPEEAAIVLGSLSGIAKRDIIIQLDPIGDEMEEWLESIWESEAVEEAIKELEQNEGF